MKKGNLLYGQSGGPTAVINASLYGVIKEAFNNKEIGKIYGAIHGIEGILNEDFYDFKENPSQIEKLPYTPGAFLGSVRHKLKDPSIDESEYLKILEVFKKYNIRYFFYNGGNDSMDTVMKLDRYFKANDIDIITIGIPKTIDNDLPETDHTPGFGSAAKYIATTMQEIIRDSSVYSRESVTIVEIMGRDTGWLTASSAILRANGEPAPHLIYLPEIPLNCSSYLFSIPYSPTPSLLVKPITCAAKVPWG